MLGKIGSNLLGSKPEQKSEVTPEQVINSKLKNLNIESANLNQEIPDFESLSAGQKVLALENLEQSILGEIKEDSLEDYQSRFLKTNKNISRLNPQNVGVLGKNLWLGITKQYQLAKVEKARSEELLSGGLEMHKEVLAKLAEGLKAYGPEVELDKNGELQINYLGNLGNLSEEEKETVAEFNRAATNLSKIPDEWRYDTAKEADKKKFAGANKSYEINKSWVLNNLNEKLGGEGRAVLAMNKIDSQVRLNQFLNSNPEVESQLLKIKDQSLVRKVLSGVIAERGLYMGAGFASRTLATLGLGALSSVAAFGGVVAGAGAIGYFRSAKRAKETIRQKDVMGRRGQVEEGELSKIFASGGGKQQGKINEKNEISLGLGEKINSIITRIENEPDQAKKIALAARLKTRLNYTKKYLDNGAVNFGSQEERLSNQYNLMTGLAQAETYLDLVDKNDDYRLKLERKVEESIYDELDWHDKKIDKKRKEYVAKQARKGMMISMGFATAGRLFSELVSGHNESPANINSVKKVEVENPVVNQPVVAQNNIETAAEPISASPNNQELVDYITNDPVLKGNLDLKTAFLNQKITVDVLTKGQGIGNYANVTNDTPVNFVQPDGSIEVHGAGEVYVHPGDRVIQTEDGQIYVVKDSGIKGTRVGEDFVDNNSRAKIEPLEKIEVSQVDADEPSPIVIDNSKNLSYVEAHKNDVVETTNNSSENVETHKGLFHKVKEFFGGKKVSGPDISKAEVPISFSKGDEVNEGLVLQWNQLSEADQAVYNDFVSNNSLYNVNPEMAIANFLGQKPAEIIQSGTEFTATLNNGHTVVFDMEEGQIIMNVDNGNYEIVDPEQIISARESIQSNYVALDNMEEVDTEMDADGEDGQIMGDDNIETIPPTDHRDDLFAPETKTWADHPEVMKIDHTVWDETQEIKLKELYSKKLEVLDEIKKQYTEIKLKYGERKQFAYFQDLVRSYYAINNEKVKNIIEIGLDKSKIKFSFEAAVSETKTPKVEVEGFIKLLVYNSGLKKG